MTGMWRLAQDYRDQLRQDQHDDNPDRDELLAVALAAAAEAREEQARDEEAWT